MIPAIARTLARILVDGTSLSGTEEIDFDPPSQTLIGRTGLTVYCYNIRENSQTLLESCQGRACNEALSVHPELDNLRWFDVSFLVSAWDSTALGEQQLLSEALSSLLHHRYLQRDILPPELQPYERLPFVISPIPAIDPVMLWSSLGLPLRPALYVTVTTPIVSRAKPPPYECVVSANL